MTQTTQEWIEIRDSGGRLLFKYDPWSNVVEIKKGGSTYSLIKLDEIRAKHGCLPNGHGTEIPAEPKTA